MKWMYTVLKCKTNTWSCQARCFVFYFAQSRCVNFVCEQPKNSLLFFEPAFVAMRRTLRCKRFVTHLGWFGASSPKPIECWGSFDEEVFATLVASLPEARVRMEGRAGGATHITVNTARSKHAKGVAKRPSKRTGWRQDVWTTGKGRVQKASQVYPWAFGKAVSDVAKNFMRNNWPASYAKCIKMFLD